MSIGLFCSTPAVAIARALPRKIAMQMLLTAEPITAQGRGGIHCKFEKQKYVGSSAFLYEHQLQHECTSSLFKRSCNAARRFDCH